MDLEHVLCPLCGVDDTQFFFVDNRFKVERCRRCGMVYVNPRPKEIELRKGYEGDAEQTMNLIDSKGYISLAPLHVVKAKFLLKTLRAYCKTGKILDVGCAGGYLLAVAQQQGYKPYGVEISRDLAVCAVTGLGLEVFCGTIEEARFPSEYFDVVTMIDVLSHLPNPIQDLEEINRILKKGGWLVIETGNRAELHSKEAVERWGGVWGSPSHLYHYTEKTVVQLLNRTGFTCARIDKSPIVFAALMELMVRKVMRLKRNTTTSYQLPRVQHLPSSLVKAGSHIYLFTKYWMGKILRNFTVDSTMVVCSQKTYTSPHPPFPVPTL